MGEGWSVNESNPWIAQKLVPSSGKTDHADPRMHLRLEDMARCYNPPQVFNQNMSKLVSSPK
jgi:hypothetical protein